MCVSNCWASQIHESKEYNNKLLNTITQVANMHLGVCPTLTYTLVQVPDTDSKKSICNKVHEH